MKVESVRNWVPYVPYSVLGNRKSLTVSIASCWFPYCWKVTNAYDRTFYRNRNKLTRVMNLSKRGEETQLEFKRTAHFLGGYLAISYLLHALHAETRGRNTIGIQAYCTFSRRLFGDKLLTTRPPCRIALFTALALGRFAPSGLEQ